MAINKLKENVFYKDKLRFFEESCLYIFYKYSKLKVFYREARRRILEGEVFLFLLGTLCFCNEVFIGFYFHGEVFRYA